MNTPLTKVLNSNQSFSETRPPPLTGGIGFSPKTSYFHFGRKILFRMDPQNVHLIFHCTKRNVVIKRCSLSLSWVHIRELKKGSLAIDQYYEAHVSKATVVHNRCVSIDSIYCSATSAWHKCSILKRKQMTHYAIVIVIVILF